MLEKLMVIYIINGINWFLCTWTIFKGSLYKIGESHAKSAPSVNIWTCDLNDSLKMGMLYYLFNTLGY